MSNFALAIPVGMDSFRELLTSISPSLTVCVRGRHAVGKSEGVHQAAKLIHSDFYKDAKNSSAYGWKYEDGLPVIERRLSQMTEGDIIGLPFMNGEDKFESGKQVAFASTQFKPCDWLLEACKRPVILFLDERNRALDGVKQAVFQLMDSKKFYGYELHPETRIVVAENIGDEYQVQACDPAEISRCSAVVTLEPSVQDWINYAKPRCHEATIQFILGHENLLEHKGVFEANKKYPDRRAWFKLDQELQRLDLFDAPEKALFRTLAGAFLGVEAATKFQQFCNERERQVSAKDILESWSKAKRRLSKSGPISNEAYVECVNKLGMHLEKVKVDKDQAKEMAKFMWDCPPEPRMAAYSNLQKQQHNLVRVHPLIQTLIVATATGKENPPRPTELEVEEIAPVKAAASEEKEKTGRGARRK
jgi:hypothetical protein